MKCAKCGGELTSNELFGCDSYYECKCGKEYYAKDLMEIIVKAESRPEKEKDRPKIVCLCGSTRFFKQFDEANYKLTLQGVIVLSIGCNTKSDEGLGITDEQKSMLDELHKRKIDIADEVHVLNVGGYIGKSTRSEIDYAVAHGKPITYLETCPIVAKAKEAK